MERRYFETQGPVDAAVNYVVSRKAELADFIARVKRGRYIVMFAPRQTGKTTFFHAALATLRAQEPSYFPIALNFEEYEGLPAADFYEGLREDMLDAIETTFQECRREPSEALSQFLAGAQLTNHISMRRFFSHLARLLTPQRVVLLIDEFDGIPTEAVMGFLHSLRRVYVSETRDSRCPYSVCIVGVKNVAQLNYDRTISPFNIQEEFHLPNFTLAQVQELLGQYTAEVGQPFEPEVVETLHRQTGGQPFLVNRLAQLLTQELDIPKDITLSLEHFATAHTAVLVEDNVNIQHLRTNVRRDARFERLLMNIALSDAGVPFTLDNEVMGELATYGVIARGTDGMCEIVNPIYLYRILRTFAPLVNGLETDYYPENMDGGTHYLTADGQLRMDLLLDNFRDFIARVGFRILEVPETPQEYVGQRLLFAYLEQFVRERGGVMYLEVPTGRGRMDLLVVHRGRKYIVETKIWQGAASYAAGKQQLAKYLTLERAAEGYYLVFDYRQRPEPRVETEALDGRTLRSYVIPIVQQRPSDAT